MFTNKDVVMDPSTTSATPLAKTNALMWYDDPDNGMQCWRHVRATADTATVLGLVYKGGHTTNPDVLVLTAAANLDPKELIGVAQHVIPANYYGWVLCYGIGTVVVEAEVGVGATFGTEGSAGKVGDASVTAGCGFGYACNTGVIGTGATGGKAFINLL